jgi:hypothetical protein
MNVALSGGEVDPHGITANRMAARKVVRNKRRDQAD